MGRILGLAFVALLITFGVWLYYFLQAAGVFQDIKPRALEACRTVSGVVGVEDLAIDTELGVAYLAGYDRRAGARGTVRGAVWVYDLNAPDAAPIDMTASALPDGFAPHGISLYRGADGKRTLFVINHAGGKHSIELFDVAGATLTHRRTVTGAALVAPNDLVGVGADAFYVSNDHGNPTGWMRTAEDYLRLKLSTVQYFDGNAFSTALENIGGANGINVSADGRSLYLSAASELTVYVYDRDPATAALKQRAAVAVPGFADNIDVLANGDLLLGVHTKIFDLLAHVGDAAKRSPSHILHLRADSKGSFAPETIYYNDGAELSGASVAAASGKRLLIGPIFEAKVLDCTWASAP